MVLVSSLFFVSCTQNQRAKQLGGTATYELPKGKKLITVTWKKGDLWYLTRDMREGEKPETYEFQEESNFGIMEGKVIVKESK